MPVEFSVMVETAAAVDDETAEDVVDVLVPLAGVVHLTTHRWGARFTVDAPDARAAGLRGWEAWHLACRRVGLVPGPVVRLDVTATDELDRVTAEGPLPELVGVAELAAMLGVSSQRASQLARDARFPRPCAHLASGPVWDAAAVRAHAERWPRRPGRPPKEGTAG